MAKSVYAGNWQTRRVKLGEDERVLRTSSAVRYEIGILAYTGVLTLTTHRLIWTPFPYIADIRPWIVTKTELRDVAVVDQSNIGPWLFAPFQKWALRVETTTSGTRRFSFGNVLEIRQRTKADEWKKAVQGWMN